MQPTTAAKAFFFFFSHISFFFIFPSLLILFFLGPVVDLWGFGPDGSIAAPPAGEAVTRLLAQVGQNRLRLDGDKRRLLKRGELSLDFSSIAKGYGVDAVAETLRGALLKGLDKLAGKPAVELVEARYKRLMSYGQYTER